MCHAVHRGALATTALDSGVWGACVAAMEGAGPVAVLNPKSQRKLLQVGSLSHSSPRCGGALWSVSVCVLVCCYFIVYACA